MNWNSHEFIWLDWVIIAVGIIAVAWAVWRVITSYSIHYTKLYDRNLIQ